jgi:signal recognition particle subunit SRP54
MLDNLTKRLTGIFSGLRRKGRLTEDDVALALREVRVALLEADVNIKVAKDFIARVKELAVGEEFYSSLNAEQTLIKIVRDELTALLGESVAFNWGSSPPTVILMAGLQGSGKTTTTAKLAAWLKKQGKKPLLAACDVQRPAAITQLQVLGQQIGVEVYAEVGGDPVQIAKKAVDRAKHMFYDVVIVDTAGRLTIDEALMDQLARIGKAVKPNEVLLVLDATTGQEAVNVAQAFHERFALTGAIFTKLDGDTRGGAILSARAATGVPVRFLGTGEFTEQLEQFHPSRVAERILGMGDIMGIIEKAEEAFAGENVEDMQAKMKSGKLDFNDLLEQFRMMKKMGSMKNIVKMIPGIAGQVSDEDLDKLNDNTQMKLTEAIILSMTPAERKNPDLINSSRKKRIAKGSGTKVEDVNRLLVQHVQMQKGMKQMAQMEKQMKKGKGRGRMPGMFGR